MKKKTHGIVYAFINKINNKMYIGKTIDEYNRLRRHCKNAYTYHTPFYCAVRKYGWINFNYVVLFEISGVDKILIDKIIKDKEKELIAEYNTIAWGYNLSMGGDGSCGTSPSQETRDKMSTTRKGRKYSIDKYIEGRTKPVLQYDLNGNLIREFFSIVEACRITGAKSQHISRCCKGLRNKTRGYKWAFKYA